MVIHHYFSTSIGVNGINDEYFTSPMFKPFIGFSSLPSTLDLLENLMENLEICGRGAILKLDTFLD